jgi:Ala-tRNA(Pro) deacylase
MKDKVPDASSNFQSTLPVSSDFILKLLTEFEISFQLFEHVPLRTVTDSKKVEGLFLSTEQGGGHIKNLYLRDAKKRNILLVTEQDCALDFKLLPPLLNTKRLSFGSSERLFQNLGVRPGAVTPLSMITGVNNSVTLFIQSKLRHCAILYLHPLVNDRTISISIDDLEKFIKNMGSEIKWIDF